MVIQMKSHVMTQHPVNLNTHRRRRDASFGIPAKFFPSLIYTFFSIESSRSCIHSRWHVNIVFLARGKRASDAHAAVMKMRTRIIIVKVNSARSEAPRHLRM